MPTPRDAAAAALRTRRNAALDALADEITADRLEATYRTPDTRIDAAIAAQIDQAAYNPEPWRRPPTNPTDAIIAAALAEGREESCR